MSLGDRGGFYGFFKFWTWAASPHSVRPRFLKSPWNLASISCAGVLLRPNNDWEMSIFRILPLDTFFRNLRKILRRNDVFEFLLTNLSDGEVLICPNCIALKKYLKKWWYDVVEAQEDNPKNPVCDRSQSPRRIRRNPDTPFRRQISRRFQKSWSNGMRRCVSGPKFEKTVKTASITERHTLYNKHLLK
jgi:hypothetical protein